MPPSLLRHRRAVIREIDGHMIAPRDIVRLHDPRVPVKDDIGFFRLAVVIHTVTAALHVAWGTDKMRVPRADIMLFLEPSFDVVGGKCAVRARDRSARCRNDAVTLLGVIID